MTHQKSTINHPSWGDYQINKKHIFWHVLLLFIQQRAGLAAQLKPNTEAAWIETSGYVSLRSSQNESSSDSDINRQAALALLKSKVKSESDLLAIQLRPLLDHSTKGEGSEATARVDELYWEHRFSPFSFTFLGRKKIVNGVAIGRNPSDFLNQGKTEDRTLTDEERRAEKVGDGMLGWSYFGQSYSTQALLAAPADDNNRIRAMLQLNSNLNALSTDVSLIAYYADRPALGMNLSTTQGEQSTFYAEAVLRKGRDRRRPVLSANRVVTDAQYDAKRWIMDIAVGGQYTTDSGITLSTEYWRNNNGFSGDEYAGIINSLTSGQGNPRLAGNLLSTPGLRKNSAFFRIADLFAFDALKGEITWIRNLDDRSNFLRSTFNWEMSKADSFRTGIDKFSGTRLSEYGASKIDWRLFIAYKKYF